MVINLLFVAWMIKFGKTRFGVTGFHDTYHSNGWYLTNITRLGFIEIHSFRRR